MTDLVKRLRDLGNRAGDEAADRIEALEAELASVKAEWTAERDSHEHTLGLLAQRDAEFARYKAWHDAVMEMDVQGYVHNKRGFYHRELFLGLNEPCSYCNPLIARPKPLEDKP